MLQRTGKGETEANGQTERFFESLLGALTDGIVITDAAQGIVAVNEAFCSFFGRHGPDVVKTSLVVWLERLEAGAVERWSELEKRVRREGRCLEVEFRMQTSDGLRHFSVSAHLLESGADEERGGIISIWRDVTERVHMVQELESYRDGLAGLVDERSPELDADKEQLSKEVIDRLNAEKEAQKLNRMLRMLSECNQILIRAADESRLMREICRIIVEVGGYRLAWVGLALEDEKMTVSPVAHWGHDSGYLDKLDITWADTQRGRGPTGKAIRTGMPWVLRDIPGDPSYRPWRDEALKRGFLSSIALPLKAGVETFGALNIYAEQEDAFDYDEFNILMELAEDLSFGLGALRTQKERDRAQEALVRAHQDLEKKVEERTAELALANNELRREIEERRRAEQALRDSEDRYRTFFQASGDGILVADIETRYFKYANPSICNMLGYSEEELRKLRLEDIHPKESLERVISEFEAQARGEKTLAEDIPCLRKDGTRIYADINTTTALIDGIKCNVGFFRNVTEKKMLYEKVIRSERLAVTGQMAALVANEINSPLQDIIALPEKIRASFGKDERLSPELDLLRQGLSRIGETVESLLDLTKPGGEEKQPCQVNKVIAQSTALVRGYLMNKRVKLNLDLAPGIPLTICSPQQLGQIFLNLTMNAVEAMSEEGRKRNMGQAQITIRTRAEKADIVIVFADNGPGISQEELDHIFDPFYSTKRAMGMDIGLSVCHRIIEDQGGSMIVENSPEGGAVFTITLPAA